MRDPLVVVLMGVSGSRKTTIGRLLAELTEAVFADADDFHSAANKEKMASGTPLNDEDRQPWLQTLNALLLLWLASRQSGVLAGSALKERYRATLTAGVTEGAVQWVFLDGVEGDDRQAPSDPASCVHDRQAVGQPVQHP